MAIAAIDNENCRRILACAAGNKASSFLRWYFDGFFGLPVVNLDS
jgi:hypothetical protein